jgi:hypothetical protein
MRRNWGMGLAVTFGATLLLGGAARADLVGHWTFDGTLNDSTLNGNNGTFSGSPLPSFSNDVPSSIGAGQSVLFGGGSGHVLVPDNASLDITGSMTIAAWVKPNGNVAWDGIVAKSPSDGSLSNHAGNYELRLENGTRRPTFHHQRGGLNDTIAYPNATGTVANNAWQHVAVTATNGGSVQFYVNGAPAGSFATVGLFGATNNNPLYIGTRADLFTTMDGWIDDLKIYNNALSPTDVFLLANPGIDPGTPYPSVANLRARASTFYTPDNRNPTNAVNNSGMVGRLHQANAPGASMWLSASGDVNPTFDIDLGGMHIVDDLRVWNYNENANATCCLGRGVRLADVYVAGADGVFGATPVLTGVELDPASGTLSDFSQVVTLGGVAARYVRLAVTGNHGDASFTGLSEVKVTGNAVAGQTPLPVTVSNVSSNLVGFNRNAAYAVNGTGLGYGDSHSIAPDATMWLNQGTFGNVPEDQFDLDPEITFDLGSEQSIATMKIWNYNETLPGLEDQLLGRGIALTHVLYAREDGIFETLYEFLEVDRANGSSTVDYSQSIDMQGVVARYVKFDIVSNHGGDANFVGLSEVQFFGVPEPSTYAMAVMGGLALVGAARRRRRSV